MLRRCVGHWLSRCAFKVRPALLLTGLVLASSTSIAYAAGSQVYFEGYFYNGSEPAVRSSDRHSLTQTSVRSLNGRTVCTASSDTAGFRDSAYVCSTDLAIHSYCGCTLRHGLATGNDGSLAQGRARIDW